MLFSWIWLLKKRGKNTIIKMIIKKYQWMCRSPRKWRHIDDNPLVVVCRNHKWNEMTHYICYPFQVGINHIIKFFNIQLPYFPISIYQTCIIHYHTTHTHTHISFINKLAMYISKIQNKVEYIPMMFGTNSFSTVAPANSSTLLFDLCIIQLLLDLKWYYNKH